MKLLSGNQLREWDEHTVEVKKTSFLQLMENAATACVNWLTSNEFHYKPIKIFCGKGNNGGDGLVIARMLIEQGANVHTYILEMGNEGSRCFKANLTRLVPHTTNISYIQAPEFFPPINETDVVIDCLYGTGLNREVEALPKQLIRHINDSRPTVIAVDVPSGMFLDKTSDKDAVIRADYTLTFEAMKLCFMVRENASHFGQVHILPIGLDSEYLNTVDTQLQLLSHQKVKALLKKRNTFSHKGDHGHALVVAGSKEKMGAALLCAKACLRSGVGLLTCCVPECNFTTINTVVPEAMAVCNELKQFSDLERYNAIGIGPGLGSDATTKRMIISVVTNATCPLVVDADGLNTMASLPGTVNNLNADTIITPHPKEFERLFGESNDEFERIRLALSISQQLPLVIILKGHHTLIAYQGKGYFNTTGNPGLAKGGSGDVLTGILTALRAQHYSGLDAALLGVYLHGLAGDLCLEQQSEESLLASDLIERLGDAFRYLRDAMTFDGQNIES